MRLNHTCATHTPAALTGLVMRVLLIEHDDLAQLAVLQLLTRVVIAGVQVHQRQQVNQRVADLKQG